VLANVTENELKARRRAISILLYLSIGRLATQASFADQSHPQAGT